MERNSLFEQAWELMTLEQKAQMEEEAAAYYESVKEQRTVFLVAGKKIHEDDFLYKKRFVHGQHVVFHTRDYVIVQESVLSERDHTTVMVEIREATSEDRW